MPTKKAIKKAVKKTAKTVPKKTTKPATKKVKASVKKAVKKVVKKVAKKAVKPAAKKVTKPTTKKVKAVSSKPVKKAVAVVKKAAAPKPVKKVALTKSEKILELKAAELMKLGRERGYVTYDELLRSFPEIEKDIAFLDVLYDRFSIAGIDVLQSGGMLGDDPSIDIIAQKNAFKRSDSGYDSIQMYLREIGQYPLLNAQEERVLAKRIVDGDEEARNLLARANLRLVVSIAKKYVGRSPDLGRDPMPEEIATEMGVEVEKVYQIEKISQDTISLELPVGDDDDRSRLSDFISDDKIVSPDQEVAHSILTDQITEILDTLSEKERKILEMRHGLLDGTYHTLEEVGKEFGVTRERIRQIEAKALEKIRQHEKARRLKSY